jgi:L-iduronidase
VYGQDEIRSWLFETTNEPDGKHWWPYSIPAFLNYYDACSEGLKEVDPRLRFGGPCVRSRPDISYTFKALLDHCDCGKNFFTGEVGIRLDYISFHVKDLPQEMINREKDIFNFIVKNHPKYSHTPLINDEADPIRAWATPLWWERGPWYAAFIAQNIDLHQRQLIENHINYSLLSNDHAFMGEWNQRTTHTLFKNQKNAEGFYLIKKPVLTVMELIAQLGNQYIHVEIPANVSNYYGIIATKGEREFNILVYNKTDIKIGPDLSMTHHDANATELPVVPKPEPDYEYELMAAESVNAILNIKGIDCSSAVIKEYRIDYTHGNPHEVWLSQGSPTLLSQLQFAELKNAEKPELVKEKSINFNNRECSYELVSPSASVILLKIIPIKK